MHSRRKEILCFAALWIPYAVLVIWFWFVTDDAYISFRYAQNWAAGDGIRYNIGPHVPVEGYSNFLWVAFSALLMKFGAEIIFWAPLASFLCGSILLYLVFTTLLHKLSLSLPVTCLAVLMLSCSPPFALWSTGGLETMPFALLMFITFERLILRENKPSPVAAGIAGLALSLIRVEGIFWAILIALVALLSGYIASRKRTGTVLIYLSIVIVGYAIYWLWRYSYYDTFFSNTIYAKAAFSWATIKRGFDYVITQFLAFLPLLLIFPGLIPAMRSRQRAEGIPVAAMALSVIGYAILVGGDFMPMGRFMVPGLAFNAILIAWLLKSLWIDSASRQRIVALAAIAVIIIGVLPAANIHLVPEVVRKPFHFRHNSESYRTECAQWVLQKIRVETWITLGRALRMYAEPSDTLVAGAIGAVGYYSELYIYDKFGLTDREVASRRFSGQPRSPGHDKKVEEEFFLDRKPDIIWAQLFPESKLRVFVKQASAEDIADRYVADFLLIPDVIRENEQAYIGVLRRIPEGTEPDVAWKKAWELLDSN